MMKFLLTIAVTFFSLCLSAQNCVTISGIVSNFEGYVIPNAEVSIKDKQFNTIYSVKSDSNGYYSMAIPKGRYHYLTCIRIENYPNSEIFNGDVKEAKLEFWGWGIVADKDTTLDIHYDRMEVYGVNVFEIQGGTGKYQIYFRPMSLTRFFQSKGNVSQIAPPEGKLKVNVFIDGDSVSVLNQQRVVEDMIEGNPLYGFIITTTKNKTDIWRKCMTFRIMIEDLENGDKGEAIYTYFL